MSKKNLVIVESPAKAKTINKILGNEYIVKACMGHVRDLPPRKLGVDIDDGFKPQYVNIKGKERILKELKKEAGRAEAIYLAPDPDREGEAIAWHLAAALRDDIDEDRFLRVTYNEITAPAIRAAFANPGQIDHHKVDSQQARRVLDRIVGYKVSPLLWRRVKGGSSAGRVQSVALRLVCEREEAILSFVPEEFWLLGARVCKQVDPRDPFAIKLARINDEKAEITTGEQAEKIRGELEGRDLVVSAVLRKEISKRAQPPYITSTLQQAGSRFFGFSPARSMQLAQKLYEGVDFGDGPSGLITYMRTDSVFISKQAQEECLEYVRGTYGEDFVPAKPNFYKSRGGSQEAHEAIRPTDVNRTPEKMSAMLPPAELKLYRIIWQRFVASQMAPARIAQRTVEVEARPPAGQETTYLFRASTSDVVFPGYMKATGVEDKGNGGNGDDKDGKGLNESQGVLPQVEEGERLDHLEWLSEQKFTQPPGRYTEASLIRALEENGVGRPSTYAQILFTLQDRKYVDKEKRSLKPTDLGSKVKEFLVSHLGELFDVNFTAAMEESLDKIEQGDIEWTGMLKEFYGTFEDWLGKAQGPEADPEVVRELLVLLKDVKEWGPEVKRGKRTYSDERFVTSLEKQLDTGKRPISGRQNDALKQLVCRYREQIPTFQEHTSRLGLEEALKEAEKPVEPPREATLTKLNLLKTVTFAEPRTVGKRTYDDSAFSQSLREQVEGGKRLTPNQLHYLDRLVTKYSDQIENFEAIRSELGLDQTQSPESGQAGALVELAKTINEWKPPVQRGKRTWDDHKFYESLASQFEQRKELSVKQVSSLKKLLGRYAAQIPRYREVAEELGLKMPKEKKGAKTEAAEA